MGKRHFLGTREQMLFVCLVLHAFVFLNKLILYLKTILKTKENVVSRDEDITEITEIAKISDTKKAHVAIKLGWTWAMNIKTFDIYRPIHCQS